MKCKSAYIFTTNNDRVVGYVKNNLVKYFGSKIFGRYVKCKNAENTLKLFFKKALEKQYNIEGNIIHATVNQLTELIKEVSGVKVAHPFVCIY